MGDGIMYDELRVAQNSSNLVPSFICAGDGVAYDSVHVMQQTPSNSDEGDAPSSQRIHEPDKTSSMQSFIHLVKGYIGPGCLSLPWAFSKLGIFTAISATGLLCLWSSYNCWSVIRLKRLINIQEGEGCEREIAARISNRQKERLSTYPDISSYLYGDDARNFTKRCICVQQLAICTVFLSFVGTNLRAVLESVLGWHVSHAVVITIALPFVLALSCLTSLKALAPFMALGTALFILGGLFLAVVIAIEWPNRHENQDNETLNTWNWKDVPLALCAILYSFEGICLILPIESSMLQPRHFFVVFVSAMLTASAVFSVLAGVSVATFGDVTNGSITAFLLTKYTGNSRMEGLLLVANSAVSLSVLITYPLQLFPALELLLPEVSSTLEQRRTEGYSMPLDSDDAHVNGTYNSVGITSPSFVSAAADRNEENEHIQYQDTSSYFSLTRFYYEINKRKRCLIHFGIVLSTYVVAVAIPNIESLISLAGALAGSSTALIIPPALELAWLEQLDYSAIHDHGYSTCRTVTCWEKGKCYIQLVGGFCFLFIGTAASLGDIAQAYIPINR